MKTAVEWLIGELQKTRDYQRVINEVNQSGTSIRDVIEQAKEMEKEYIVNAHYQGYRPSIGTTEISEQYYNETFKQQEQ